MQFEPMQHKIGRLTTFVSRTVCAYLLTCSPSICTSKPAVSIRLVPKRMAVLTDNGRPMKPFFIEMQNFWAWADKLGR